jgi:thiol-disulfide isomerase/thioredoxin
MMINTRSICFAAAALTAAGAAIVTCFGDAVSAVAVSTTPTADTVTPAPSDAILRPLDVLRNSKTWLTALPKGPESLRGKVVVVNFWTYSCINSLRALPYLRAWNARYAGKGLVVVGVHAPEFEFERDASKVRLASTKLGVTYPNLQDNDFSTWQDFGNQGWPGFYFIDAKGKVRAYRVGEGNYAESERLIRKLLAEAGHDPTGIPTTPIVATGIEAQAAWQSLRSNEAYVGYAKAIDFRSPGGIKKDQASHYDEASELSRNQWDLGGTWNVGREFATLGGTAGTIRFRFHARDVHLVLGTAADGLPVPFRITLDSEAPGAHHGTDVDAAGRGEIKSDRLYQLIRQTGEIRDRTVTIEFARPGVRAYVFTFG